MRFDYRWKLHKITDKQDLYSTERSGIAPHATKNKIDQIQRVGTEHADFVDDEQLHVSKQFALRSMHTCLFPKRSWRKEVYAHCTFERYLVRNECSRWKL